MKVILISGKARHGKDTVADMLEDKLKGDGYKVELTHYADLLKYICKNYFGWDGVKDDKGRDLLQHVGTDVIRNQDPSFWVDFVTKILNFFKDCWDFVIIPDCRFPNEINKLKEAGFDTVHLRISRPNFESPLSEEQQKHPSETALDNTTPDILIENSSDLKALRHKIDSWVDGWLYKKE